MAGITSIGTYIPKYRLSVEEVTKFWSIRSARGGKAVAGFDEDSLTMAVAAALAVYQQYLIRHREGKACFKAFLNNNWFGAAIFCGIALNYVIHSS